MCALDYFNGTSLGECQHFYLDPSKELNINVQKIGTDGWGGVSVDVEGQEANFHCPIKTYLDGNQGWPSSTDLECTTTDVTLTTKIIALTGYTGNSDMNSNEMIDIKSGCTAELPDYPMPVSGATGVYENSRITICGGTNSNKCYKLKKNGISFELLQTMGDNRTNARSIVTEGNILVTGGVDENNNKIGSGEFIKQQIPNMYIQLPYPVNEHWFLNINQTTSFLIGGTTSSATASKKTYFFNHFTNEWTSGPDLIKGRHAHTAGVLFDHDTNEQHIAVIAGNKGGAYLMSTEILYHGNTTWTYGIVFMITIFCIFNKNLFFLTYVGPNLPLSSTSWHGIGHQAIVRVGLDLVVLGGQAFTGNYWNSKKMYKLSCRSNTCHWDILPQQLKTGRFKFVAVSVPDDFMQCE